jgi:hypothetical protein
MPGSKSAEPRLKSLGIGSVDKSSEIMWRSKRVPRVATWQK